MNVSWRLCCGLTFGLICTSRVIADENKTNPLAENAAVILERNCVQCHRGAGSASRAGFDVRSVKSMIEWDVIKIGKPAEQSRLWDLAHRGTMPPRSQPQLPRLISADADILKGWIESLAELAKQGEDKLEFPAIKLRPLVRLEATLQAIYGDLRKLPDTRTRAKQRYFTLMEAHNNPAISDDSLLLNRAALSKAINSLSWEREIVQPRAVDPEKTNNTLFAVDIEQLGWLREHWSAIRSRYPYAIGFTDLQDRTLSDLEEDILRVTEKREPVFLVRADWFVATALQPALYHALLYELTLPELVRRGADKSQPANQKHMTANDLEQYLQVNVIRDIEQGDERAMRCGFTSSGVSAQNRLIERHRTKFGAYWKSYDFKADNRRAILSQFPLGPHYPGNPAEALAFEHDGGEIIFHLPNGLQAYLLVDGKDRRIDAGPIEVVSDALKTSGSPAIVNGLSCMSCHKAGMIDPPADEIREYSRVFGRNRDHVQRLYPRKEDFERTMADDAEVFKRASEKTIGSILKTGLYANRDLDTFPEPVSDVARDYLQEELDLKGIAAELHEPDLDRLKGKLASDEVMLQLGLGVLLRPDGKIKRAFWESKQNGPSVMQLAAFSFGYTTPQFRD